jgi:hypothetical protein
VDLRIAFRSPYWVYNLIDSSRHVIDRTKMMIFTTMMVREGSHGEEESWNTAVSLGRGLLWICHVPPTSGLERALFEKAIVRLFIL